MYFPLSGPHLMLYLLVWYYWKLNLRILTEQGSVLCLPLCLVIMLQIISKVKKFPSNAQLRGNAKAEKSLFTIQKERDGLRNWSNRNNTGLDISCWRIKKPKLYKMPGIYLFAKVQRKRKTCLSHLITAWLQSIHVAMEKVNAVLTDVKWIFCSSGKEELMLLCKSFMWSPLEYWIPSSPLLLSKRLGYRKRITSATGRVFK